MNKNHNTDPDTERCLNCHTTEPESDIQGGLCAACFAAMPEGRWITAGRIKFYNPKQ
jgi:hypothetical protein